MRRYETAMTTVHILPSKNVTSDRDGFLTADPAQTYRIASPDNDSSWELVSVGSRGREVVGYWRREKLCRKHDDCLEDDGIARACLRMREKKAAKLEAEAEAAE